MGHIEQSSLKHHMSVPTFPQRGLELLAGLIKPRSPNSKFTVLHIEFLLNYLGYITLCDEFHISTSAGE